VAIKTIERGVTPEQVRDNLVKLVNSRFDYSEKFFYAVRTKLPRLYDVWRGIYTGRFHPHKNNVHVPLIYAAIWADAARKTQASLNQWPIVQFRGYVSQVMWDRRWERVVYDEYQAIPLSTQKVRSIREADVITFDGNNWENVDLLDAYPQPGFRLISGMKWFGRRYYLDFDDLVYMSSPRPDGRPPVFDFSEVERLRRDGSNADQVSDDITNRKYMSRLGMSDDMARILDSFSRPVEIREYWGIIPSEMAINGETNVVISIANRKFLLRARGNPFWHRQKPFIAHSPTPDPQYFHAPGKAEVAEKMQLTANRYVNQRLDAADIQIDPQMFYDRNAGIDTERLYARPGGWIGTDGPPGNSIMPMPNDFRGLQAGAGLTQEMTAYIERATGITDDTIQGLSNGPDRETARGVTIRREAAGTRLMLESRIYEETYLEPLANMMMRNNRQFLEGPVEVYILGDNANIDPDTGNPIQETRATLEGYELAVNYSARAVGATNNLSKLVRRQELIPLLQAVQANPFAAGAINWVNFFRQIFREFDMDNVNELINKQAQQNTQMAQVMQQAQGEGAPNAAAIPDNTQGTGDGAMALAQFLGQQTPPPQ
jgi:protein-disulfide isomerase-like protein with CxxC motif